MAFWKKQETYKPTEWGEVVTPGVPPLSELISLGWQTKTVTEENPNTGAITVREVDYRLLMHRRHRSEHYIQWSSETGPIEPLQTHTGTTQKVTPLGVIPRRSMHQASDRYSAAPDDRVTPIDQYAG